MRFATTFAGYMIALSIDAPALYEHLAMFVIVLVLVGLFYIDIVTLSLGKIEALNKTLEDYKQTGETQNDNKKDPPPPGPIKPT